MQTKRYVTTTLFLITFSSLYCQSQYAGIEILKLVDEKRWFDVNAVYFKEKATFNEFFQLRTESYLYTHFNKPEAAVDRLERIANEHAEILKLDIIPYLDLLAKNYATMQNYDKSHEIYSYMLKTLSGILPSDNIGQLKEATQKYLSLKSLPKHKVILDDMCSPIPIDTLGGLVYLNFSKGEVVAKAVFDTGANMNYATEETAKKLGIKAVVNSNEGNEGRLIGKIGILDSFYIGENLIENALFFIVPSSEQLIEESKVNLIIGTETIRQFKGIEFNLDKMQMTLFAPQNNDSPSNMIFDNGLLYINLNVFGKNVIVQYDSGFSGDMIIEKSNSMFHSSFSNDRIEEQRFLSVSDTIIHDYQYQNNIDISIDNKNSNVNKIYYGNTGFVSSQQYEGVIGKTVIEEYSKIKFDFENMILRVNN